MQKRKWWEGRPKTMWVHTTESEMRDVDHSWGSLQKMTKDRQKKHNLIAAPHTVGCNECM